MKSVAAMLKPLVVALVAGVSLAVPSPDLLDSDVTILSDNDLQGPGGPCSAFGALYVSREQSQESAIVSCEALGEQLWSPGTHNRAANILGEHLKSVKQNQAWIFAKDNKPRAMDKSGGFMTPKSSAKLPVLCTQTAPYSNATSADVGQDWQIQVESNNETVTGFRDRLTFRFRGIRFAPQPKRFTYPTLYSGSGEVVPALKYGPQCIQVSGGSEDCLFLNIWTPSLPSPSNTYKSKKLKPVLFWIYGGGFTENSAADPNFDGGNMASRGDVVMVAPNYRVGAFGFLALKDGTTNGNFGIADQILALNWVRKHIQDFGGDPEHITIVGQSSGGASVRALMASPLTAGKFVGAIAMSTPGTPGFSEYYTIDESVEVAGNSILAAANCTNAPSQVECLRAIDATTLVPIGMPANHLVVDGTYLTTKHLQLTKGTKAPYRFMTGLPREDGAPFLTYPPNITAADQSSWITSQGLPNPPTTLFPLPNIQNQTLAVYQVGARLMTDLSFRCMNQATAYAGVINRVFSSVHFFEFDRSYQTPDWPHLDLCEAPRSPAHPLGDPNAAFDNFHCHSGQLLWIFGNIRRFGLPYRDEVGDREFEASVLDRWAAFVRGEKPGENWKEVKSGRMEMMSLKWPESEMVGFRDLEQCGWLALPIDYLSH
ncbi:alpha/beta-Hydrolase [Glarea lozoyensis ATCC 20868]|uniref:Carboxylic ester hydrolase n=1 Tax=Glarea lozoyensis (strain ATCC 20868 / MF5171) TaxID=1116229 RepID=S3D6Q1_GLAL2|nr:alpha/beta-Hydrolase [Glarea lozoyensis ATCC 20868]EPE34177.1 alpha/beta-Hydrolase [Glarea lozoyensis ATCC 20868]